MADTLGDYMKDLEGVEASRRAVKGMPIIARLDGRAFHTFTHGLKRPFDENLTKLMQNTTQYLVEETNALIGYTQSDEITLVWNLPESSASQYLFDGRFQKMCSILSATATAFFNKHLAEALPSKKDWLPLFDARVWQVPTLHDAYLALQWREKDAIKNSITMVALSHFSHNELQNVNGDIKREMLMDIGDPWEGYASCYRKGSYFKRVEERRQLTEEEMAKIPERHRTAELVTRKPVKLVEFPNLSEINEDYLF
jgi:tRNA(His) guanylyltransferase